MPSLLQFKATPLLGYYTELFHCALICLILSAQQIQAGKKSRVCSSLSQCSSTFFVMVHPENSCDELMHPELQIYIKINMQKDNCTTVCTKNNARQKTQQIPEIIFNDFLAVAYYQPTFYTEIFFNCSPHQWIDVIEFLLLVARSSLEWEVRDSNLGPVKSLRHFFEGSSVAQAQ